MGFVWPGVNRLTTASDARSLSICSWLTHSSGNSGEGVLIVFGGSLHEENGSGRPTGL